MPEWLADPGLCLGRPDPFRNACIILLERNWYMSSPHRLKVTDLRAGQRRLRRWSAGKVYAERDGDRVVLAVRTENRTTETPSMTTAQALEAADALRAAAVNAEGMVCGGQSIQELAWDELMTVVDRILSGGAAADGRDPGRAEGMAMIIAIFQNPYRPNIEAVRKESTDRWYAEQEE